MKQKTTLCQRCLLLVSLCLFCASGWAVPKAAETEDDQVGFSDAVAPPRTAGKTRALPPPVAAGTRVKSAGKPARQGGKRVAASSGKPRQATVRPGKRLAAVGQPSAAAGKPVHASAGRTARPLPAPAVRPTTRGAPNRASLRRM
ncbi:MAG TPA: hypothetical protein PKA30_04880 [Accumulibacter sp.]|uniref:hypothetical protein n=1 Tax=Accumulibacter sp. TaxID=2053492 RepID=UPI002BEFF7C4|nr:hypothetical protein [Accumulibacter sp.]HMV04868.1 hypothetical protein [Accumulibacter sp.]